MKAILFSIFFLFIFSVCFSHDLNWRSPVPAGLEQTESRGAYTFYKENDSTFLTYCNGKLCEIFGRVDGKLVFDKMIDTCIKVYGRPNFFKDNTWIWYNQTDTDFLAFFDEQADTGYYLYHYTPLFMEIKEERAQERKEKEHVQTNAKKAGGRNVDASKVAKHKTR